MGLPRGNEECAEGWLKEWRNITKLKKIIAIIRKEHLEKAEQSLIEYGIKGVTVTQIKGFGEYANFYTGDWMSVHARVEIFVLEKEVGEIVERLMEAAHTGNPGDGMVAVMPVDMVYRIKTKRLAEEDEI